MATKPDEDETITEEPMEVEDVREQEMQPTEDEEDD